MKELLKYNRRSFLKTSAIFAGGLLIPFNSFPGKNRGTVAAADLLVPNAYLRIGADDSITVLLARCEMGQGVWTALPMLIAEELDADWSKIKAEHAPAAAEYFHTLYATQRTGGSSSTLSEFERYRKAGATARYVLVQAAANRFKVRVADCRTENGQVIIKGKKISYGALVNEASRLELPKDVPLRDPSLWKIIGKSKKRLDTPDKSNGKAVFGMDVQIPGALTALVARKPFESARIKSMNKDAALKIPGVRKIVDIPQGVAVLGEHFWAAKKGREALDVKWDLGTNASIESAQLLEDFKSRADRGGLTALDKGNVEDALKTASKMVEVEYFQPFIAHAPMEPLNVTVRLSADQCDIWTGSQTITDDQKAASELTGLPIAKVVIHTVFLGGSFGRRNITRSDFVREAVEVAKASGEIIKTVWTREDDIQGGMYRPAFLHRFKVGLDKEGMPAAWKQVSVGQSVMKGGPFEKVAIINGVDVYSLEGMMDAAPVAAIEHKKIELNTPVLPITIDNWRAVGLSHTVFAMESLSDEMAHAAGIDPVAYRMKIYRNDPRLTAALKLAAEKSGWGKTLPKGQGMGVAVFRAVGSFVALIAEVSVADNFAVKVNRVTCVVDCGIAINPDGIVAQMESSVNYGISSAMYSEITFKSGKVQQHNFYDYQTMRMNEMPVIDTYIIPSMEKPGGIGEAAVSQMIPALTNAIYAATGKRIRKLPVYNNYA